MPHDIVTRVTRNVDLGNNNYLLEFESGPLADGMRPAEFFMIGIPGAEMLLRRPFSVCGLPGTFDDATPGTVQVLYRVFGKGTGLLASLSRGAPLNVLGPLGHGFSSPPRSHRAVFVAGGIGSAPFPAFARSVEAAGDRASLFYGARGAGDLPLLDWFECHCERVEAATEDGSVGHHGLVTEPLEAHLAEGGDRPPMLYACGPNPMLRAVAALARKYDVPCEVSLEAHMACGFGVCIGCVVPTRGDADGDFTYTRICVDGPVMPAERVAW